LADFARFIDLLSYHCSRLEPRLIVKVAEMAALQIQNVPNTFTKHCRERIFYKRCDLFNHSLSAIQLHVRYIAPQDALPNEYFWQAQRILLDMSSKFPRPLLVSDSGYRSIRKVLTGLKKSTAEKHISLRQSPSWPPFLGAVDGIDERLEVDQNWSRSVQAGAMQQEAGFSKKLPDMVLDIVQGLGIDGIPTIQQRMSILAGRNMGLWEASIRATRNAHEAWIQFQHPPEQAVDDGKPPTPGPDVYAAMFEKLSYRDKNDNDDAQPGDKALNFPSTSDHNLTDYEKARLQPPSISELWRHLRDNNVDLNERCLSVLLEKAASYNMVVRYLEYYARNRPQCPELVLTRGLNHNDCTSDNIQAVNIGVFASYIQACCQLRGHTAWKRFYITRAITLIGMRTNESVARWTHLIWRPVLKVFDLPANELGLTPYEQAQLTLHALRQVEERQVLPVSMFVHACRIMRKTISRALRVILHEVEVVGPQFDLAKLTLRYLYIDGGRDSPPGQALAAWEKIDPSKLRMLFHDIAFAMKQSFQQLTDYERSVQQSLGLGPREPPPLEQMAVRKDLASAKHVHDYLLLLASAGDFDEVLSVTRWLIGEWGREGVSDALLQEEELPAHARLTHPLCVYRLLAEPRLEPEHTKSLYEEMERHGLEWMWPSDDVVQTYSVGTAGVSAWRLAQGLSTAVGDPGPRAMDNVVETAPVC
jgi:hypothetical protein